MKPVPIALWCRRLRHRAWAGKKQGFDAFEDNHRVGSDEGGIWNIYSILEWVWGGGEGKCLIFGGVVKIIEKEQHLAALVAEFRWYAL